MGHQLISIDIVYIKTLNIWDSPWCFSHMCVYVCVYICWLYSLFLNYQFYGKAEEKLMLIKAKKS